MALVANSQGVVNGKFRIPENIPAGVKSVVFNGSGGSVGRATFIGQGLELIENRQVVTSVNVVRYDPLAETFMVDKRRQLSGVDLWFTAVGSSKIEVQIRETENGVPTQTVLGYSRIAPSAIALNQWFHFHFNQPIAVDPGVEYALVVLCDDAVSECAIAELGKWDASSGRWVTSQPYQVGVMLSSSNASTWTAHQDRDLAFRLRFNNYAVTSRAVTLGSVSVTNVTDLMVRANVENLSSNTDVVFNITVPGGKVYRVKAEQPLSLPSAITGTVTVAAVLNGNTTETPVLHRDVQLVYGNVSATADYVSRAVAGGANTTCRVIVEAYLPGTSSLAVHIKGVDQEDVAWVPLSSPETMQMDDGWVELTFESAPISELAVHVRLRLSGNSQYRPKVRNLRMFTK